MGQVARRVTAPGAVAKTDNFKEWMQTTVVRELASVATKHLPADRLVRVALGAWSANPKLQQCDQKSFLLSLLRAGQLGLDPSGALGQAYLVPYGKTCQLLLGYRGLIALARRSGEIETIEAHVVFKGDKFTYRLGLNPMLEHEPDSSGAGDRGRDDVVAVYAIARFKGGASQFEVMFQPDVLRIMENTQSRGRSGPWKDHYAEMARKTAVRRLAKYLPLNSELAAGIEYDNEAEFGEAGLGARGPMIDITPAEPDDEFHADNQPSSNEGLPVVVESQAAEIVEVPSGYTEEQSLLLRLNSLMLSQPERYRAVVGRKNPFAASAEAVSGWISAISEDWTGDVQEDEEPELLHPAPEEPLSAQGEAEAPADREEEERRQLADRIRGELKVHPGLIPSLDGRKAEDCSLNELQSIYDQICRLLNDGITDLS